MLKNKILYQVLCFAMVGFCTVDSKGSTQGGTFNKQRLEGTDNNLNGMENLGYVNNNGGYGERKITDSNSYEGKGYLMCWGDLVKTFEDTMRAVFCYVSNGGDMSNKQFQNICGELLRLASILAEQDSTTRVNLLELKRALKEREGLIENEQSEDARDGAGSDLAHLGIRDDGITKDSVGEDVLYGSMLSALSDVNDFAISHDKTLLECAISSIYCYLQNNGDIKNFMFQEAVGTLLYKNSDTLKEMLDSNKELKPLLDSLGIESVDARSIKDAGLNLLKEAAKQDEDLDEALIRGAYDE